MRPVAALMCVAPVAGFAQGADLDFMEQRCLTPLIEQTPFPISDLRAVDPAVFDATPEPMLGQLPQYYIADDTGRGLAVLEIAGLRACSMVVKGRMIEVSPDAVFALGERYDMGMPDDCASNVPDTDLVYLMSRAPREGAHQIRAAYLDPTDAKPEILAFERPGDVFSYSCETDQ